MTRPALCLVLLLTSSASLAGLPGPAAIDARVRAAMAASQGDGTRLTPSARASLSAHSPIKIALVVSSC